MEAVARGLTAGAEKHPGETWRQIPPEEHAARAMRHLNLYRAGDRKDTHLINAAMRCMMAYATEQASKERRLEMVIEATCMDCGRTFRYNRIRKPKEPMKRCPKCARKHYASKYLAKHRVDMLVKALRKVQAYCAGQKHGCHECAFWNNEEKECKLYGSCPIAWDLKGGIHLVLLEEH